MADPFAHHPDLRDKIDDPETSFLRTITNEVIEALAIEHGMPTGWWYPDEVREGLRARAMEGRWDEDLWVFAYGSLMWDPAIRFAEVRRATLEGFERRFILKDTNGGRGTEEAPGLFAALDRGDRCEGLAFRISREALEEETRILWQREQIEAAYLPTFIEAEVGGAPREVLAFVADHDAATIVGDLTREEQVRYIATGSGIVGSSRDYLAKVIEKLDELGITDPETREIFALVEAYRP